MRVIQRRLPWAITTVPQNSPLLVAPHRAPRSQPRRSSARSHRVASAAAQPAAREPLAIRGLVGELPRNLTGGHDLVDTAIEPLVDAHREAQIYFLVALALGQPLAGSAPLPSQCDRS